MVSLLSWCTSASSSSLIDLKCHKPTRWIDGHAGLECLIEKRNLGMREIGGRITLLADDPLVYAQPSSKSIHRTFVSCPPLDIGYIAITFRSALTCAILWTIFSSNFVIVRVSVSIISFHTANQIATDLESSSSRGACFNTNAYPKTRPIRFGALIRRSGHFLMEGRWLHRIHQWWYNSYSGGNKQLHQGQMWLSWITTIVRASQMA